MIALLVLSACGRAEPPATVGDAKATKAGAEIVIDGTLSANVGGERREWFVTHIETDGEWQSGSFWRDGPMKSAVVSVSGLTEKVIEPTGKGDMRMSMIVTNIQTTPQVSAPQLFFLPEGNVKTWEAGETGSLNVTVIRAAPDGDFLDLEGGFAGEVLLNEAFESELPRSFTIEDGKFSLRIHKYEKASARRAAPSFQE